MNIIDFDLEMARESQPPPPLIMADLHERIEQLTQELGQVEAKLEQCSREKSKLSATLDDLQVANGRLQDQLDEKQQTLQVAANESGLLRETLKERDAEIAYLQQQLEEAVAELQLARNVMSSQKPSADVVPRYTTKQRQQAQSQSAANGPNNTPMKMVQDMKDRLKNIEDKLSAFKIALK